MKPQLAYAAALQVAGEARATADDLKKRLDSIFNHLRPGYTAPPEATARLQQAVLKLIAGYFKDTIPVGTVDAALVLALFHAATAYAFAGAVGPTLASLEAELVKLLAAPEGAAS